MQDLVDVVQPGVLRGIVDGIAVKLEAMGCREAGAAIVAHGDVGALIAYPLSIKTGLPVVFVRGLTDVDHHGFDVECNPHARFDIQRLVFVGVRADTIARVINCIRSHKEKYLRALSYARIAASVTVHPAVNRTMHEHANYEPIAWHTIDDHLPVRKLVRSEKYIVGKGGAFDRPQHTSRVASLYASPNSADSIVTNVHQLMQLSGSTHLAAQGRSGLSMAGCIMYATDYPISIVLKATAEHGGHPVVVSSGDPVADTSHLMIDDIVETGATIDRVATALSDCNMRLSIVGIYLCDSYMVEDNEGSHPGVFDVYCGIPVHRI